MPLQQALVTFHLSESDVVVINVSGRGDKDMEMIRSYDPKSTSG